jgi:hypothetical protein
MHMGWLPLRNLATAYAGALAPRTHLTRASRLSAAVVAAASLNGQAADWSAHDKQLLAATLTLHACDWAQTKQIARNQVRYYESNPLLGESPSIARVNNYFAGTALATALAAHLMPRYRRLILTGALVIETSAVARNQSIGVSIRF